MNTFKACAATTALFVLGGCAGMMGKSAPVAVAEKSSDAEAKLCNTMTQREDIIREFPSVDAETPLSEVKDASDRIQSAVRSVTSSEDEVGHPDLLGVKAANEKLQQDVNGIPGGRSTVGESASSIGKDVHDLQTVWKKLYTGLQCGA